MKRNTVLDNITSLCAVILTLICALLSTVAYMRQYDNLLGYFNRGTLFTLLIIFMIIYVIGSAVMALICCMGRRISYDDPIAVQYTSIGTGAITCFYLASLVGMMIATGIKPGISGILPFIIILFGFIGLGYYILTFLDTRDLDAFRSIGAMSLVLFGITDTLYIYFSNTTPVNGDMKNILMVASISQFMFFLFEAKRILGSPSPIFARFFTLTTIMTGAVAAVPEIIATISGNSSGFSDFSRALCLLAVAIYAFVRLIVGRAKTIEVNPTRDTETKENTIIDVPSEKETEKTER